MRTFSPRALVPFLRRFPIRTPRGSARARARRAVALLIPAFVLVLAGAWGVAETAAPAITDTDYHVRLRLTRAARDQYPDRPFGLVLGSSRVVWAFAPEQLGEPGPTDINWVNAAHTGAGPTLNRVLLHRYLRDGACPDVIVIEVMPTFFVKENNRFLSGHFAATDMPVVRSYSDRAFGYDYHFLRHRVSRCSDLARVTDPFAGYAEPLSRGGHANLEDDVTPMERARRIEIARAHNADFLRSVTVRPGAARAFRDTIREARDSGAKVVLLRMPEGPTFKSWYDPAGLAAFDRFVADIAAEFGVPQLDARDWLTEDDFYDSHHVLKRGAAKFTARFARNARAPREVIPQPAKSGSRYSPN